MRRVLALLVLLLLLPAAHAATPSPLLRLVAPGESGIGDSLQPLNAGVGYLDGNGNGKVDAADPNEPVYLDLDGSRSVSYADVRLTAFLDYPAGSMVAIANRDLGLSLGTPSGWFASSGGDWFLDFDYSASISAGDLRLSLQAGTKVLASDHDNGAPLEVAQGSVSANNRVNYVDRNGDRIRQAGEPIVLDMDENSPSGARHYSVGDLVVVASGFATEPATSGSTVSGTTVVQGGTTTVLPGNNVASVQPEWRSTDWALLALTLLNLVGLIVVARNLSLAEKPRNPFR